MGIEVSAFSGKDRNLAGFMLSGRWPATTREWTQFLAVAVRFAAMPGLLPTTTVFRAVEDLPEDPQPDTVGLITAAGPVLGDGAPRPGQFAGRLQDAVEVAQRLQLHHATLVMALLRPGVGEIQVENRAA